MNCHFLRFAISFLLLAAATSVASGMNRKDVLMDIGKIKGSDFNSLLSRWSETRSSALINALFAIAKDSKISDRDRYIALMGFVKLEGIASAPKVLSFLKDPSWMLRTAALRALKMLRAKSAMREIQKSLFDRALVVRLEAVQTVVSLFPEKGHAILAQTLKDPMNYSRGKALWIPKRVLEVLKTSTDLNVAKEIGVALNKIPDRVIVERSILVLESITGRKTPALGSIEQRMQFWSRYLNKV